MDKTRIFISSTCYDLTQIRQDLKEGIRRLGHEPILSESKDFPVDPNLSSIENCIEAVKKEADIFVLIIGDQYGSQLESGRSITNTEFLTAVEKGIPVYSFTLRKLIDILPVWRNNPEGDFSHVVGDNKVFEFIEEVRSKRSLWNFEFEKAQDILEILTGQLSFLLKNSMLRTKALWGIENVLLEKISSKATEILVNKPELYELRFFFQVLADELDRYQYLKKDCVHSVILKSGQTFTDPRDALDWQMDKLGQLNAFIESLNNLFNAFNEYYGAPGTPSDLDGLYYVAHRMGAFYASILDWIIDVKSVRIPAALNEVNSALAEIPSDVIKDFEEFVPNSMTVIEETLEARKRGEMSKGMEICLNLQLAIPGPVMQRYKEGFVLAKKRLLGE